MDREKRMGSPTGWLCTRPLATPGELLEDVLLSFPECHQHLVLPSPLPRFISTEPEPLVLDPWRRFLPRTLAQRFQDPLVLLKARRIRA